YLSKKYGVPSKRDIEKWVFAYKAFGKDGLMRSRKNESYSFEFKLHVGQAPFFSRNHIIEKIKP
ncbi:MAG: hypothetical protein ACRC92_15720, partial [Peptostreptococcaceae bacterium]